MDFIELAAKIRKKSLKIFGPRLTGRNSIGLAGLT
jgi:hypothetical protein